MKKTIYYMLKDKDTDLLCGFRKTSLLKGDFSNSIKGKKNFYNDDIQNMSYCYIDEEYVQIKNFDYFHSKYIPYTSTRIGFEMELLATKYLRGYLINKLETCKYVLENSVLYDEKKQFCIICECLDMIFNV